MNILEQIQKEHSKENTVLIARYICENPSCLEEVIEILIDGEKQCSQRISWVIGHVCDINRNLLIPYVPRLIDNLSDNKQHVAVKRNTWRLLQDMKIPETHWCCRHSPLGILSHTIDRFCHKMRAAVKICYRQYPE